MKYSIRLGILLLLNVIFLAQIKAGTYSGGTGTSGDPYQVSNLSDLEEFSSSSGDWGSYFIQTADIDASSTSTWNDGAGWSPIGESGTEFTGQYDGGNFAISGLTLNRSGISGQAFFGIVEGATIKNLGLTNVNITAENASGALISEGIDITVQNCYSSGSIAVNSGSSGGLIGEIDNSSSGSSLIEDSYSSVTIAITSMGTCGGIIGYTETTNGNTTTTIQRCYFDGIINGGNTWTHGGIIGDVKSSGDVIQYCYNKGSINGYGVLGGIVGNFAGNGSVSNSYNMGNVTGQSFGSNGGILGASSSSVAPTMEDCYNAGTVNATGMSGGIYSGDNGGGMGTHPTVNDCFYDNTVNPDGSLDNGYGTATSTTNMQTSSTYTSAGWNFTTIWTIDGSNNSGYPYLQWQSFPPTLITWDGSTDSDWNTGDNWDGGVVPTSSDNVQISNVSPQPSIGASDNAECNNITIDASATLTIASGGSFIPSGTVTNNGSIVVQRSVNGSNQWYMISSPVVADISDSDWNPTAITDDFYAWYEPSPGKWVNYFNSTVSPTFSSVNNSSDNFLAGKGYLISYNTGGTKSITSSSVITSGDVTFSIAYSGSKNRNWEYASGWNLLGNPYPSGIDWNDATRTLFADNFAYVYDAAYNGGDYREIDGSSADAFIAPNQGFFVIANQTGTFTFTNSMRAHGGTFYKDAKQSEGELVLRLSSGEYITETRIREREESENERDRMDALKLFSFNSQKPQLFSISEDDVWLSVNSMPRLNEFNSVKLGVRLPSDGVYELSITEIPTSLEGTPLYIEDLKTSTWHRVDNKAMSFEDNEGDIDNRFVLHAGVIGVEEADMNNMQVSVYATNNILSIINNSNQKGTVTVTNLMGQVLNTFQLVGSNTQTYSLKVLGGIYIVSIETDNGDVYSEKVFMK